MQEPLNTCPAVSAVCCCFAVHVVGLLMVSVRPCHRRVAVYQPFEPSVPAVTARSADGPVASYLNEGDDRTPLPAWSVHVPETVKPVPSAPLYVPVSHGSLTRPLRPSAPSVVQAGELVYQSLLPFGAVSSVVTAEGAVASILNG